MRPHPAFAAALALAVLAVPASSADRPAGTGADGIPVAAAPDAPWLHLLAGHATVLRSGGTTALLEGDGPLALDAPAHLQLPPGGELELRWPGRASLRLVGPAAVEWFPARLAPAPPAVEVGPVEVAVPGALRPALLRLVAFRRAEVEVRRGVLDLELPAHGRRVHAGRSAFALEPGLAGALRVVHRAGVPPAVGQLESVAPALRVGPTVTRTLPAGPARSAVPGRG